MKTRGYGNTRSLLLILSLISGIIPGVWTAPLSASPGESSIGVTFSRPPLRFELNEGQLDPQVRFTARDRNGVAFLTSGGAVLQISKGLERPDSHLDWRKAGDKPGTPTFESSFIRLKTVGANPAPVVTGMERLPGVTHYLIGNDRQRWRTHVAGYAKVKCEGVYPGVDLVYYSNQEGRLEYDFIIAPGADPDRIAVSVEGAQGIEIDPSGDLLITTATGTIRQSSPRIYQEANGKRQELAGGYRMVNDGRTTGNQVLAFALGDYDRSRPLVIDPEIVYATYLGGSSISTVANEGARGVAVDSQGAAYIVGTAISLDFPTLNPVQGTLQGLSDVFITKIDANGQLVYSTYLGGSGFDGGAAIKVDDTGAAYVGGSTCSADFPTVNPLQATFGLNCDAFVAKLSPDGAQLVYSTYLGGADVEGAADLALDAQKNLFVLGNISPALDISANDFPTVNPIQATHGGGFRDGFISVINSSGSSLLFSTYLGGDGDDFFQSLGVDPNNGDVYLSYFTDSNNFSNSSSSLTTTLGVVFKKGKARLTHDDFFFFILAKEVEEIVNDPSPDSFYKMVIQEVFGQLRLWFVDATTGGSTLNQSQAAFAQAAQLQALGGLDIRLSSFNENLNITNAVFFGGSGEDTISALAVDAQGAAYVIGSTRSTDLPTVNPIQAAHSGGDAYDGFLAVFHPVTLQPVFATYLGGTGVEFLNGITVDALGNIYIVGETWGNFPTPTPNAIQNQLRGRTDAFLIKISPVTIPPILRLFLPLIQKENVPLSP